MFRRSRRSDEQQPAPAPATEPARPRHRAEADGPHDDSAALRRAGLDRIARGQGQKITFGIAGLALLFAMPACAKPAQQSGPDPAPASIMPARVHAAYALPDGFRNIVEFCDDGGNMVIVTSRGSDLAGGSNGGGLASSVAVVAHDQRCQ